MNVKYELQNIISGIGKVKFGKFIQTVSSYLKGSQGTGSLAENDKQSKSKEAEKLKLFIEKYQLWVKNIDFNNFVSEGAEQRVFLKNGKKVLKLNDAIYYVSWADYFHNLLLNNYFFRATAYDLKGFYMFNDTHYMLLLSKYMLKLTKQQN